MGGGVAADRLARQLERVAATAPTHVDFHLAADELLRPVFDHDASAWATVDPASGLHTGCTLPGMEHDPARDELVFEGEVLRDDVNRFVDLANGPTRAATLREATGGELERSWRYRRILAPFGITDELRIGCVDDADTTWANLVFYRVGDRAPFSAKEVARVARLGSVIAKSVRLTLLRQAVARPEALDDPPGTLLLSDGEITATTEPAERWLDRLGDDRRHSAVTAAAMRANDGPASIRVPAPDGSWIGMHAAQVKGSDDTVAVIVERLRPAELAEVIVAALGLTPREREVAEKVLAGRSTQQTASELGISAWTVQDHLKAVFAKAGVASRGELAALLNREHYVPRVERSVPPGPYGWFLEAEQSR